MSPLLKSQKNVTWNSFVPYLSNFLIINIIYGVIRARNLWHFFGFTPMKPSFADLRAYTSAVTCSEKGINFLIHSCDPWGRNIGLLRIYVPIMKFFHLNESHTNLIGNSLQVLLFFSIYCLAYALRVNLKNFKTTILILLFLISPPVALLIERGQLEILLFVLIVLSAFLLSVNKKIAAYLLIAFVSILKLYPIILFGFVLINQRSKNSKFQLILGLSIFGVVLGSVLSSLWSEGTSLWAGTLGSSPRQIFGVVALPFILIRGVNLLAFLPNNLVLSASQTQYVGIIFFILILIVLRILWSRGKVLKPDLSDLLKKETFTSYLLLFSLCLIYLSYFLVSSFEYRMVYLAPLLLIGLTQIDSPEKKIVGNYLVYGTIIAMWAQVNNWTSALVQFPIYLILAVIFCNILPSLHAKFSRIPESS